MPRHRNKEYFDENGKFDQKAYSEKNKETLKAKRSIYVNCVCGTIIKKCSMGKHLLSKRHIELLNRNNHDNNDNNVNNDNNDNIV